MIQSRLLIRRKGTKESNYVVFMCQSVRLSGFISEIIQRILITFVIGVSQNCLVDLIFALIGEK